MDEKESTSDINKLKSEITSLIDTIISMDKKESSSLCSTANHAKRISYLLPTQSHDPSVLDSRNWSFPVHQFLCVRPLTNTELPMDILETLASHFDVNEVDDSGMSCLNIAIVNKHYNAVKCLVKHGADCNILSYGYDESGKIDHYVKSPIALLAENSNTPLDLFDLLHTAENLNGGPSDLYLPLHVAVACCNAESALHLIQLGASVDKYDVLGKLPIEYYEKICMKRFQFELFEKLVPSGRMAILWSIGRILTDEKVLENDCEVGCKLVCHLVQRLIQIDSLSVSIVCLVHRHRIYMEINKIVCLQAQHSSKGVYLISFLLLHLDWNIVSTPHAVVPFYWHRSAQDDIHAHAIDNIWNAYIIKPKVRSLLTLCIQQTRKCMNSLTSSSFMSLLVPSYIRRLLMYRNVADVLCEAWQLWPKCNLRFTMHMKSLKENNSLVCQSHRT